MKEREIELYPSSYLEGRGHRVVSQAQINERFRADLVIYRNSTPYCLMEIKGDPLSNLKIYSALGQLDVYLEVIKVEKGILVLPESVEKDFPELFPLVKYICNRKGFAFVIIQEQQAVKIIINAFVVNLLGKAVRDEDD